MNIAGTSIRVLVPLRTDTKGVSIGLACRDWLLPNATTGTTCTTILPCCVQPSQAPRSNIRTKSMNGESRRQL